MGAHAVTGAQKSVPSLLSSPKKASNSQIKYEALEISEVGGPLKGKCLYIIVKLDPFGSKVLYLQITIAVGSPFESKAAILHITVAVGHLRKQGTLHITFAIVDLVESVGLTR